MQAWPDFPSQGGFFVKGQDDLPLSLLNGNIYINISALMLQYEKW